MNDYGSVQLPPQASTVAPQTDALFHFIFWGCTIFFLIVVSLTLAFVIRYRRRPGRRAEGGASHHTALELTWTLIPLALVIVVFLRGFNDFMDLQTAPGHALEYQVVGKQWMWQITHPNGETSVNEMWVPVDTPVKLVMQSEDVIHSFFVPAFRVKMDLVPNRYTTLWFQATRIGDFDIFCAEYCGTGHSRMVGKIHVLSDTDYRKWQEKAGGPGEGETPAAYGKRLFTKKACVTCHTVDGTRLTGPSLLGKFGSEETLADGSKVLVDENYVRESILEPQAKVVAGFQPVMPTYTGLLKHGELDALVAYLKSIGTGAGADTTEEAAP